MKPWHTLFIGLLLSVFLLALVLAGVDLGRVQAALSGADYGVLLPAFLLLVVGHVMRAVRWRALLAGRLSLVRSFSILNISYLFNGALPFRLGEVARLFLATRVEPPVPAATALSTILVERLLDLLSVVAMLGLILVMLPVPAHVTTAGITLGAGSLVGVVALTVFVRRQSWAFTLLGWLTRRVPPLTRWPLETLLARFLDGLSPLASWRGVLTALFWSVVSWGFSVVAGYILLFAFFPQPTWAAVLLFIVMASLAVAVPYVPGAVGPYEAGVILALNLTGFDQPEGAAVAFAIVLHATNLAVYSVLGVLGLLQEGVTLGQVARGARAMRAVPTPGTVES